MRILIIHNRYRQAGGEDVVVDSESKLLRSKGHDVLLFEKSNSDFSQSKILRNALWPRSVRSELDVVISNFRPDVAHVHNVFHALSPGIYGALARRDIPVIQTLHNFRLFCIRGTFERNGSVCERCLGHSVWPGVVRKCYRGSFGASALLASSLQLHRILRTFERHVDTFVALNRFCREKFILCGLPPEKIVVKPNFVEVPDPGERGSRKGGLYVGRMAPEKGISVLADALGQTSVPFLAVGEGLESNLLRRIPHVNVLGPMPREDVFTRMRESEFLVVPSVWYETFGLVMVEAFANRLPVIASNLGAMAELIEDGVTGLLFDPGCSTDLAEKINWAHAHPGAMRRMGAAARLKYEATYTKDVNYQALKAIYDTAQAQPRRSPKGSL